ncbi:MAG: hypothetical protein QGG39_15505 [Candidatus Poribacteria bacterium]|nr:hypothetical protein [Candidatus Poribacteria bacterium]
MIYISFESADGGGDIAVFYQAQTAEEFMRETRSMGLGCCQISAEEAGTYSEPTDRYDYKNSIYYQEGQDED